MRLGERKSEAERNRIGSIGKAKRLTHTNLVYADLVPGLIMPFICLRGEMGINILNFKGTSEQLTAVVSELGTQGCYLGISEAKHCTSLDDSLKLEVVIMIEGSFKGLKNHKDTIKAP